MTKLDTYIVNFRYFHANEKKILMLSHLFYAKVSFSSKIVDNYHPISYSSMNHANNSDANFESIHALCHYYMLHLQDLSSSVIEIAY